MGQESQCLKINKAKLLEYLKNRPGELVSLN